MKRVFVIINLLIILLNTVSSQTMIKENDSSSTDSVRKTSVLNQIEREFTKIEIRYFNFFEEKHYDCTIWQDSIILAKRWYENNVGKVSKEEVIKDTALINSTINFIFYFFVDKNKYIIINPRPQGEKVGHYDISFQVNILRKGYNPIKKDINVDPDFTYSEEFMEFLKLLDSF